MPTRIIVNGAAGKMGALACETIAKHPDFELVGALTRGDDLKAAIAEHRAEIVVDLTRADCVYENSLAIIESGAHPVIGTTGLLEADIKTLEAYCQRKNLGGIIVPNFSIGAVLMMRFAAEAASYLGDVEIIETHHSQKFEAPSGTAIKTAEMIAKVKLAQQEGVSKEVIPGVRGGQYQNIRIHSLRLPGVLAKQEVIFGTTGETLSITHNSIDRACFMPGIILCCQKVTGLSSLHYGLEQLL